MPGKKSRITCLALIAVFCFSIIMGSVNATTPQYAVTSSANAGGTISPAGTTDVNQGSTQAYTVTANAGNTIGNIAVDGSNTYVANYTFTTNSMVNSGDGNEKIVIVNSQRYILTNNKAYSNGTATINVYTANSNWQPTELISMSPIGDACKDFYIMAYPSILPDLILICGGTNNIWAITEGFIASFNVTSQTWTWADQPSCEYTTNILNPYGTTILIQSSAVSISGGTHFYMTTAANLFTPSAWTEVAEPNPTWEGRIAYFNGLVYDLQCNSGLSWALNRYNITSATWVPSPIMSINDTSGWPLSDIFPYVWADPNELLFTCPIYNAVGNQWDVYYSTDGVNFNLVTTMKAVGGFNYANGMESHCFANDVGNGLIAVLNEQDNNPNGYVAIMTLQGAIINEGGNYVSHETGCRFIIDGNNLVLGSEDCCFSPTYPAGIKVIPISTALSEFTYTFSNVQATHTITANFNTPPTNSLTLTPAASGSCQQFSEVPNPGVLFSNQFEEGSGFPDWSTETTSSGGTVSASTATPNTGQYSALFNLPATLGSTAYLSEALGTSYNILYEREYVDWLSGTPASGDTNGAMVMALGNLPTASNDAVIIYNNGTAYVWAVRYEKTSDVWYTKASTTVAVQGVQTCVEAD